MALTPATEAQPHRSRRRLLAAPKLALCSNLKVSVLAALLVLVAIPPGLTAADAEAPTAALGRNAALTYGRAIAALPDLSKDDEKVMDLPLVALPDEEADRLVERWANALRLLHQGAAIPACSWGVDIMREGPEALLPHLAKARLLGRGACFRALCRWAHDDRRGSVSDLMDAMTLARHVGGGGQESLIAALVQIAMERKVIETVAPCLVDAESAAVLAAAPNDLLGHPAAPLLKTAVLADKRDLVGWMRRTVEQAGAQGQWERQRDKLVQMLGDGAQTKPITALSAPEVLKLIDGVATQYDQAAALFDLPFDQFGAKAEALSQTVKASDNPFVRVTLPAVTQLRLRAARLETEWAMVVAAGTVLKDGPAAIKQSRDPYGVGPFEYKEIPGGFELKSKLQADGKPVVLRFGVEQ